MSGGPRGWNYFLEFDGSERADAERAADRGDAVGLVRAPPGAAFAAERLLPGTGWRRTTALTQELSRGGDRWFFPVDHDRVVGLLNRWASSGHLPGPVRFEATVPVELERTLAEIDDRHAARDALTAVADEDRLGQVRSRVLDGPDDFADGWLDATGNEVVLGAPDLLLSDLVDAERVASAFRAIGAERLLALAGDPRTAGLAGQPPGFELATTAADVRAFDDHGLLGPRLLVDGQARAAVLDAEDHVLFAGPGEYLTAVLDRTVPEARAAFAAYAVDHPELAGVRHRYERFENKGARDR